VSSIDTIGPNQPVPATASTAPTNSVAVAAPAPVHLGTALPALFKTLRPHQWVKNLFVAAPLLFAQRLFHPASVVRAAAAVAAFCMLSGAVYVFNDVLDIDKDRAHPRKRFRPIPSGQLPIRFALGGAVVLMTAALAISLFLGPWVLLASAGYGGLNLIYSIRLKHTAFLDVLSISCGFLLRVLAGSFAILVEPSGWLLACTGLLACFLGFGKRAHELATAGEAATAQRRVLGQYRLSHLRAALYILAVATIVTYALYTMAARTAMLVAPHLAWTTPFCFLGIGRFLVLVGRSPKAESPTDAMLHDWPFLVNLGLWAVAVTAIIYAHLR
jgi:4-hydroxybenzoate polyprenyltransferase